MKTNLKQWQRTMDFMDKLVLGMCIAYGLSLLLIYFSFNSRMMPCFLDPLLLGILFFLLGIYPLARKKSLERMKRRGRYF